MTMIFALYLQASGFPSHSSEYAFECSINSLDDMVTHCPTPLLMLMLLVSLCRWPSCHQAVGVDFLQEINVRASSISCCWSEVSTAL